MLCGRGIKEVRYGSKKELQDTNEDTLRGVLVAATITFVLSTARIQPVWMVVVELHCRISRFKFHGISCVM